MDCHPFDTLATPFALAVTGIAGYSRFLFWHSCRIKDISCRHQLFLYAHRTYSYGGPYAFARVSYDAAANWLFSLYGASGRFLRRNSLGADAYGRCQYYFQ